MFRAARTPLFCLLVVLAGCKSDPEPEEQQGARQREDQPKRPGPFHIAQHDVGLRFRVVLLGELLLRKHHETLRYVREALGSDLVRGVEGQQAAPRQTQ